MLTQEISGTTALITGRVERAARHITVPGEQQGAQPAGLRGAGPG
jgi:hypothetical protein